MSLALFDGVTLTLEAALSAATGTYGAWDAALWDTATWGPDDLFVDISATLRSFSTVRKFGREVAAWQAGTANYVLGNLSGDFSMDNLSGPYVTAGVTGIRPWRPIRQTATYAGITYPLYRGYAQDWIESYPVMAETGKGDAIVSVPCIDELGKLAAYNGLAVTPTVGASELFGARIHRILNNAGHTGTRAIEVGSTTMQATNLSANTVTELKLTADSEGGSVYIGADGAVIGEQQYALVQNTRSITSQATFGDGGGAEIPYSDIQLSGAGDLIVNIASYARVGSTSQVVSDLTSRALYGDRTDPRTDLICETDAQAAALASWKVSRFKAPERRVQSITIKPRRSPTTMFPIALGLRVRDLVTVIRRPPGGQTITQYCHVAGISHQLSQGKERQWVTTFDLFSATPYRAFSTSIWDTGLWGSADNDPNGALWF